MDQPSRGKYLFTKQPVDRKPRILVAPLDWGLGHATRCIPIITELLSKDSEVWLAGEGAQKKLLQSEFPDLPFIDLDGYRVRYARSAAGLLLSIFRQSHKILAAIRKENSWLKKIVSEHSFDAIISDNRYGLNHPTIPTIFITHQLRIKSPFGKWTEKLLQKKNYQHINRFSECWVPDFQGQDNLAGALSHPEVLPQIHVYYLGILSRLDNNHSAAEKKDHLLVILSGPEPQRTILEEKIIQEVIHYQGTATIVRGLPGMSKIIPSTGMIRFYNHLDTEGLNKEVEMAEYVISRSGYSTIMDMVKMQKKTILIPTPGQSEQEYLADHLLRKQIAFCISQKEFSLRTALQKAREFAYRLPSWDEENILAEVVSRFVARLSEKN